MPRKSTKLNKTPYQIKREELGLSRAKAAELLDGITEDRLEGIENGRIAATPDDILQFADKYGEPSLCNAYCSGQCRIGQRYVPQVDTRELPSIVLGMIATLNNVNAMKDRLIAIAADGNIDESEQAEFVKIQEQLEQLSISVEALQLWVEKAARGNG
ncbi:MULTISPECIES: helix-turn-helix transcriptional regulator [unclassified Adlercreutzia]|uniref:helix-turn-helix domain-containing protein n=1 Tax=unclassified Adlercreutzia TaxID=2636013 RepID=UPI0013ECFA1D|nr:MULTISPECIES: helix-turn-helix transcriptional regulator [unclassified Adlercreutzia]